VKDPFLAGAHRLLEDTSGNISLCIAQDADADDAAKLLLEGQTSTMLSQSGDPNLLEAVWNCNR
jgi:hypothetical protein